ncbi:transcriptional regulator [Microbacterium sp. T32]|nr:transcriptional regulator [Microbacterium sp. T32]
MTDVGEIRRLIEHHPWVTLVSAGADGLVASHYAVLLDDDRDDLTIVGHVGKPDDAILDLGKRELLVVVQGPHGYITPRWYGDGPAVPTWNFVSAHLSGIPEILTPEENLRVLDRLVERFEGEDGRGLYRAPNDAAFVDRLAAGTVGFRLTPSRVVGKRKLSQNRPAEVVDTIIEGLADGPDANPALAAEMQRAADARRRAGRA